MMYFWRNSRKEQTYFRHQPSSETQRRSIGSGERARRQFLYGRKSPWVRTLTELFPKIQADAGSWLGAKNALYYCAQSANSFSWVLSVSSYTTAIVLPLSRFVLLSNDKIHSLHRLGYVDTNSAPEEFACIWQSKRVGIITIETEKMWIPFSMRRFRDCQPSWYLLKIP